jgi:hypothetical protein
VYAINVPSGVYSSDIIHQRPIESSSVTAFHISSAFDETKMIFHLLNIQKDNKIQPFSFCQVEKYCGKC